MKIKRFEFNMFPVNCYVLWDETQEAVIIDAGCFFPDEQEQLKDYIERQQLKPVHLLNTHLHLDHIFGNAYVGRTFGLKPEASRADEFLLDKAADFCHTFGFNINEPPAPIGHYLNDGDTVTFGHSELTVISVPGHSPGGLAFYNKEAKCLFSGDSLFHGSIGRADLEGGDFDLLRASIIRKLFVLPDDTVVYPGHGDATTIGAEKIENPFFR